MGDLLHCPHCGSTECSPDPDDDPREYYALYWCDDCGNGFEAELSMSTHSVDPDIGAFEHANHDDDDDDDDDDEPSAAFLAFEDGY